MTTERAMLCLRVGGDGRVVAGDGRGALPQHPSARRTGREREASGARAGSGTARRGGHALTTVHSLKMSARCCGSHGARQRDRGTAGVTGACSADGGSAHLAMMMRAMVRSAGEGGSSAGPCGSSSRYGVTPQQQAFRRGCVEPPFRRRCTRAGAKNARSPGLARPWHTHTHR